MRHNYEKFLNSNDETSHSTMRVYFSLIGHVDGGLSLGVQLDVID